MKYYIERRFVDGIYTATIRNKKTQSSSLAFGSSKDSVEEAERIAIKRLKENKEEIADFVDHSLKSEYINIDLNS